MKTRSLKCCLMVLISISFIAEVDAQPLLSEVLNFGFEAGAGGQEVFADWGFITSTGALVADNGPSAAGSNAASITALGIFGGFEQYIAKSIPISSGEILDFSFDYKTLPGATGQFTVQLRYWTGVAANGFSDGGGGVFLGEHNATLLTTNGAWETRTATALPNISPLARYVDIRFIANAFGIFEGTALGDNFILHGENTPGDFDLDGDADGNDFLVWQRGGSPDPLSATDLYEWEIFFGRSGPVVIAATAAVPEPTTLALVLLVFTGSPVFLRRRS